MADLGGFNANEVEPNQPFEVIPAGDYKCVLVASEVKATSDGEGKFLKMELQICAGEFINHKLFDRLNLWNKSEKAVAIARGTLSAICRAVNVLTPKDSSELHNKPLLVRVAVTENEYQGQKRKQNEVKGYKPIGAAPAPQPSAQPTAAVHVPGQASEIKPGTPW